ncbi:hypothetical protein cyc_05960 [Cyclospora cayetanensis]|uniref:Uncharacterized protein n=1 Tax=Cyclospora cayetanensis TaxID=88456 RepID=A0A1D3CRK3_9EIME|nr:hypothetical protein cyc_05960 [Cyclospora cayetanensis]
MPPSSTGPSRARLPRRLTVSLTPVRRLLGIRSSGLHAGGFWKGAARRTGGVSPPSMPTPVTIACTSLRIRSFLWKPLRKKALLREPSEEAAPSTQATAGTRQRSSRKTRSDVTSGSSPMKKKQSLMPPQKAPPPDQRKQTT